MKILLTREEAVRDWQERIKKRKVKTTIIEGKEEREIETPAFFRTFQIGERIDAEGDEESRTFELSFSSEDPYERFYYIDGEYIEADEVLDHDTDSVRMEWLQSGNAPLLKDHDRWQQVGIIEKAEISKDRRGIALVRFGRSSLADDEYKDVKDGIRKNISVGYIVHRMVREKDGDREIVRVIDWEPIENSTVSIPADRTVGIGRGDESVKPETITQVREVVMDPKEQAEKEAAEAEAKRKAKEQQQKKTDDAVQVERQRIADITALGARHNMGKFAQKHIEKGTSTELFKGYMLDELPDATPLETPASELGMEGNDSKRYSLMRIMRALANPQNKTFQDEAAFEFECSAAVQQKLDGKKAPSGVYIPLDVRTVETAPVSIENLQRAMAVGLIAQRDLTVGGATAGAELVGTDHLGSSWIEALRNALAVRGLGARILSGLVGNVSIPKVVSGAQAAVKGSEQAQSQQSELVTGSVTLSPQTVSAWSRVSRDLMLQSDPSIDMLIRDDLLFASAEAIDLIAINEILNAAGVGVVSHGTNGGAPDWAKTVEHVSNVMIANALRGRLGWLFNGQIWGKLMTTEKAANTANFILNESGPLVGHPHTVSQQMPANLTKGAGVNLSAEIFGNWADLLIGEWGTVDLMVDPYSRVLEGDVQFVIHESVDTAVRHGSSFSMSNDVDTQ